jgi:hypothetical protein
MVFVSALWFIVQKVLLAWFRTLCRGQTSRIARVTDLKPIQSFLLTPINQQFGVFSVNGRK